MTPPPVVWDEAIAFPSSADGTAGLPIYWISVAERVRDQASTSRGKQYEWDQQQAGNYQPTLINTDQALLPTNTASPYSPNVLPRRPYRKRFQFPATQQLLTGDQATMGEATGFPAGTLITALPLASAYDANAQLVTSGTAFQGTLVASASIPTSSTLGGDIFGGSGWTVHTGAAHTFSGYVRIPTGTQNLSMIPVLRWRDTNGNVLATSSGTPTTITAGSATWVRLSVSATPPFGVAGGGVAIVLNTNTTTTEAVQTDAWQIELAAAPSTWVQPGVWGSIINGWTDRWPQVYTLGGTYTTTTPIVVDTFARFSQVFPLPPFYSDVLALNPTFFYPLDDPQGSTVFRELTGNANPAPISAAPRGPGTVAGGDSIQATIPAGLFLGAPGPAVKMTNPNLPAAAFSQSCSCIELDRVGITGPPETGGWTRMIAFNNTVAGGSLWVGQNAGFEFTSAQGFFISGNGGVELEGATTDPIYSPGAGQWTDGNWHLMFLTNSTNGLTFTVYVDGVQQFTSTAAVNQTPKGIVADAVGATIDPGGGGFNTGYNGDVAHVAEWPVALSSAQIVNLHTSWRLAWQGDSSGDRYNRILNWSGYTNARFVPDGATQDMGPATDVDGNTDTFTLLNNVTTTENGNHYISESGVVTFEPRTVRYNQLSPTWTFGANAAAGELPYADVAFDFDLDHVTNDTQITQQMTNQVFTASDPVSQATYDTLTLQRTINVTNPLECVDAATYLVNRYSQPLLRVDSITLNPSRTPALWAVLATMDISARIRVNVRQVGTPTSTPTITFDGFVEQIAWTVDASSGDTLAVCQVSPADLNLYWVLSALHTTVITPVTAGATAVILAALPDSASNPAKASFCFGLQMTLDPGTANAETLTVASFSATSPGYVAFTVTFTTAMAHNHGNGALVCEKLPAGITDPTTWDIASILGTSTTLAY
jgi:hypothetical protein